MRTSFARLVAAALLAAAPACHDASAPDDSPSSATFTATFNGAVSGTVDGDAAAAARATTYGTDYLILLRHGPHDAADRSIGLGRIGTVAGPGTYAVGDSFSPNERNTFYGNSYTYTTLIDDVYRTTGGTLTITSRTSSRITGNFDVSMRTSHDSTTTLHVVGTFDAPVSPAMVLNYR
jgi:hypothetical protein